MNDPILEKHGRSPSEIRDELLGLVLADLMGPKNGPDEEVDERNLTTRYILGRLAPRKQLAVGPEEQDELGAEEGDSDEDGETEIDTKPVRSMFPSSMGMSFAVSADTQEIQAKASWGKYEQAKSEIHFTDTGSPRMVWKRIPVNGPEITISLKEGAISEISASPEEPEIKLRGLIQRTGPGDWFISLFLDNMRIERTEKHRDADWIFQPELTVFAKNDEAIFIKRSFRRSGTGQNDDLRREEQIQELNYFNHREFAVGHQVSVRAEQCTDDPRRARRLKTEFIPLFEQPDTEYPVPVNNSEIEGIILDMKQLADMPDDKLFETLEILPEAYSRWIQNQHMEIEKRELSDLREIAVNVLDTCKITQKRILEGIRILRDNEDALEAFRFSNRAMHLQRIHTVFSEHTRSGKEKALEELDIPEHRSWRLFQLAFILINLPALADLNHPDRSSDSSAIADLLWFPTGGGKTEAYLGLTAFAIAIRRLQGNVSGLVGSDGVTVLMRYTLRLLTLQQFQRSAALICAAEYIRRDKISEGDQRWGETPFRIGLWVGKRTTPNKTSESNEAILREKGHAQASNFSYSGSPDQLTSCPWCGRKLNAHTDIDVELYSKGRSRTLLYCSDPLGSCDFSRRKSPDEGIPVLVVDEEIYRLMPSLVIATVDKFAQIPWKGPVQMLFGQVDKYCPRHGFTTSELHCKTSHQKAGNLPAVKVREHGDLRPPDLIIQDELHLISGPLGTLVGLYETAIDELCSWEANSKRIRPKLIASTATIRLAEDQIKKVFARSASVFPTPGISIEDNFFSRRIQPTRDNPGRLYMGVNACGERIKIILIRVYLAFMAAAKCLHNKYGKDADPYMTLVGYFNSIRELGGMRRLVEDDITSRLYRMDRRGLCRRKYPIIEELTSRKTATDIPRILDRLEQIHPVEVVTEEEPDERPDRVKKKVYKGRPIDVLLATNMISVGVDVKRFGLMIVTGQPKTTAEYIQATSRIGRHNPGIVCTVYNWTRPRDLSHYERFEHYHDTFYKHVEAITVTPFSPRALDRGLSGILVGLIRLAGEKYNENKTAGLLEMDSDIVRRAVNAIKQRAQVINNKITEELDELIETNLTLWREAASGVNTLGYKKEKDDVVGLLVSAGTFGKPDKLHCLNSLREVEQPVNLVITDEFSGEEE